MGIFDFLPCCGPRKREEKDNASIAESTTLLPPGREDSILSSEGPGGYGAIDGVIGSAQSGGLTGEQRARIEEIGREVGNQMLPIHTLPSSRTSPSIPRLTTNTTNTANPTHPSHPPISAASSTSSSRPSSPSPMRPGTSPPGGVMKSPEASEDGASAREGDEPGGEGVEVVQKRLFGAGGLGVGGGERGRKVSRGRGGRGRGKGRAK